MNRLYLSIDVDDVHRKFRRETKLGAAPLSSSKVSADGVCIGVVVIQLLRIS